MSVLNMPGDEQPSFGGTPPQPTTSAEPAPLHELYQEIRHDALQSISSILMVVAAGKHEAGDPELVRRRLDQVGGQTRALAGLLEEAVALRPVDAVVDVSAEAGLTVQAQAEGYPGTMRFVGGSGAWALLSPASLTRILTNLLQNARRAAGDGGTVQVKVLRTDGLVVLEVEDDGPGFGHLETVHGIGLRSTQRLLRTVGGSISFGAGQLGGALVRVCLPAVATAGGGLDEDPAL
jgi:signal transduction histidine kinase